MSILLVEKRGDTLNAAVMMRDRLYAYEGENAASLHESQVYLGVVDRVLKGVNAVFVRLPNRETGFLQYSTGAKLPASGERLIVQVRRPAFQNKKALLTEDISLAGNALVYLPRARGIRVSSRITEEDQRRALRDKAASILPEAGGFILRSAAQSVPLEQLKNELDSLVLRWQEICEKAKAATPAILWTGNGFLDKLLQEEATRLEYVLTNAPEALPPSVSCPVRTAEHPFLLHNVPHKLEKSLRRTVQMKSGATLVIDPCEAMTVIDVNSAQASGESAEKINLEAAWDIARLLRLRGIGGMIVIDFIDLPDDAARDRLIQAMREALKEDPIQTTVHDITPLGLMEMTRRRTQSSMPPLPDQPCPHCGGTGVVLSEIEEDAFHA